MQTKGNLCNQSVVKFCHGKEYERKSIVMGLDCNDFLLEVGGIDHSVRLITEKAKHYQSQK